MQPESWMALATLTILEIVLGVDNIIFISVVASKLPKHQQASARRLGLVLALISRLALLASIAWLAHLTEPLFTIMAHAFSGRDLVLFIGGLFLLYKASMEIHETMEGAGGERSVAKATMFSALVQIMMLDVIFSLDSVITAVGMVGELPLMIAAVVIAMLVMLWASGPISAFIDKHPTTKMLAFSFLILIGVALVADGLHFHIPRGYIYFAVAFSLGVEVLNIIAHKKRDKQKS
ncbi:MAG: TerC family protein [Proteobacteria bacterium]|nr:TerC family protein [Pseudomonadota bacterium]